MPSRDSSEVFGGEFLRRAVEGPYRHGESGFGFRLHHNRVRYPRLLATTVSEAFSRVASFLEGVVPPPRAPLEIFVRSRRRRKNEPRAAFLPRTASGRSALFLNLHNRERLPLDSVFFWELVRAALVHEFVHAFVHSRTGGLPLPAWMDEGTARFVEREVAPRAVLARGTAAVGRDARDAASGAVGLYEAGHRVVEYLVRRFGLSAWFDCLADVSRYLAGQRGRIRAAHRSPHASRVNRRIDLLLRRRFGLDRSGIAQRLGGGKREHPAEVEPAVFDLVLAGRIEISRAAPPVQVALALLFRPACHEAPVVTSVARSRRAVRALLGRARREDRPIFHDAALAFRLATGRLLHRPIPPPFRAAVLALARETVRRGRTLRPASLVRIEGDRRVVGVATFENGLAIRVDPPPRCRGAIRIRSPGFARRIASLVLPGECLPAELARELARSFPRDRRLRRVSGWPRSRARGTLSSGRIPGARGRSGRRDPLGPNRPRGRS